VLKVTVDAKSNTARLTNGMEAFVIIGGDVGVAPPQLSCVSKSSTSWLSITLDTSQLPSVPRPIYMMELLVYTSSLDTYTTPCHRMMSGI